MRDGLVDVDSRGVVRPPQPPRRLPKAIAVDEVERSSRRPGIDGTPLALRDRALIELLYGTGARISEAVGLDVDDVDLDRAHRVLLSGKGGKQRRVPLGSYAGQARRGLPRAGAARPRGAAARGTPKLLLNSRGGPLSRQSAWTVLRAAAERAGLRPAGSRRTRCATRSPPTCSRGAPTCAWCRNCSATRR